MCIRENGRADGHDYFIWTPLKKILKFFNGKWPRRKPKAATIKIKTAASLRIHKANANTDMSETSAGAGRGSVGPNIGEAGQGGRGCAEQGCSWRGSWALK